MTMSLPRAYQKHLALGLNQLVFQDEEELFNPSLVTKGILFVLARWSGASQLAFRTLNKAISKSPHKSGLSLIIADTDWLSTQKFMASVGDIPSGKGETYWIRNGFIIHKLEDYDDFNVHLVEQYTKDVIDQANNNDESLRGQ